MEEEEAYAGGGGYGDSISTRKWNVHEIELSTPLYAHSMVSIDDENQKMIITGGGYSHNPITNVELLNLKTKTKKVLPDMVHSRYGHSSFVINDYLYVIGGYRDKSVHRLNISELKNSSTTSLTSNWETNVIPDMDEVRSNAAAVVCNKYIYLFGGYNFENRSITYPNCIRYRPGLLPSVTNTASFQNWEVIAPMMTKRSGHAAVNVGDKIYIIAGANLSGDDNILDSMEIYDSSTDKYEYGPKLPIPLCWMTAISIGSYIVVNGGRTSNDEINNRTFLFDITKQVWRTVDAPSINTPRSFHAATVFENNKFLICGGRTNELSGCRCLELVHLDELLYGKRWERRKTWIMLRRFIDREQVSSTTQTIETKTKKEEFERSCFRHLVKNSNTDVFRGVIQFL